MPIALVLAACTEPIAIGARVTDEDGKRLGLLAVVRDACSLWGLECFDASRLRSPAMDLEIRPRRFSGECDHVEGESDDPWRWCAKEAWAESDVIVVAHEIGHLFGLEHVDDGENVMHVDDNDGREFVEGVQLDTVQDNAYRFAWLCPRS